MSVRLGICKINSTKQKLLLPLTIHSSEVYSTSRHALGLYRGIANCCRYVVPKVVFRASPTQQLLEDALARTILRLSSLRVGIIHDDTDEPHFIHIPKINIQEMLEWKRLPQIPFEDPTFDLGLLGIIEDRLDQVWTEMTIRPPWKVIVVQPIQKSTQDDDSVVFEVIFATHHSIADGKSTALVHTILLEELNRASAPPSELRDHVLTLKEVPVLAPSQEELVRFKISWSFLFRRLWNEFGPAWLKGTPPAKPWTGKPIALEPHALHLRLVNISPSTLASLLARCRAHKATLTSLLHVLVLASLSRRVPAEAAEAFRSFTAISLAPFARFPPGEEIDLSQVMTDMNTSTPHDFGPRVLAQLRPAPSSTPASDDETENTIWQLAATVRAEITKKLGSLPNDDIAGLMAWVSDWRQRWLRKMGQSRDDTWGLSNIGSTRYNSSSAVDDKDEVGNWRIERSVFIQPAAVVGPAFSVNVSGVNGGPVTICLDWQEDIVDAELIEGLADDLKAWCERFEKTGKFGIFT